jgi:hypothetical protein
MTQTTDTEQFVDDVIWLERLDALPFDVLKMLRFWSNADEIFHGRAEWTPNRMREFLIGSAIYDFRESGYNQSMTDYGKQLWQAFRKSRRHRRLADGFTCNIGGRADGQN